MTLVQIMFNKESAMCNFLSELLKGLMPWLVWLSWWERHSMHRRVVGSISSQGTT